MEKIVSEYSRCSTWHGEKAFPETDVLVPLALPYFWLHHHCHRTMAVQIPFPLLACHFAAWPLSWHFGPCSVTGWTAVHGWEVRLPRRERFGGSLDSWPDVTTVRFSFLQGEMFEWWQTCGIWMHREEHSQLILFYFRGRRNFEMQLLRRRGPCSLTTVSLRFFVGRVICLNKALWVSSSLHWNKWGRHPHGRDYTVTQPNQSSRLCRTTSYFNLRLEGVGLSLCALVCNG